MNNPLVRIDEENTGAASKLQVDIFNLVQTYQENKEEMNKMFGILHMTRKQRNAAFHMLTSVCFIDS